MERVEEGEGVEEVGGGEVWVMGQGDGVGWGCISVWPQNEGMQLTRPQ